MTTYTVERSRTIDTPIERVYPLIADFRQWPRWSPWEDLDPDVHRSYSGADMGKGATYGWSGNRKAGEGSMEITDAEEPTRVEIDLRFVKPFKSQAVTSFHLTSQGDQTLVTWRMEGPKTTMLKVLGPVMRLEKRIGEDFEKGLDRMAHNAPKA